MKKYILPILLFAAATSLMFLPIAGAKLRVTGPWAHGTYTGLDTGNLVFAAKANSSTWHYNAGSAGIWDNSVVGKHNASAAYAGDASKPDLLSDAEGEYLNFPDSSSRFMWFQDTITPPFTVAIKITPQNGTSPGAYQSNAVFVQNDLQFIIALPGNSMNAIGINNNGPWLTVATTSTTFAATNLLTKTYGFVVEADGYTLYIDGVKIGPKVTGAMITLTGPPWIGAYGSNRAAIRLRSMIMYSKALSDANMLYLNNY